MRDNKAAVVERKRKVSPLSQSLSSRDARSYCSFSLFGMYGGGVPVASDLSVRLVRDNKAAVVERKRKVRQARLGTDE